MDTLVIKMREVIGGDAAAVTATQRWCHGCVGNNAMVVLRLVAAVATMRPSTAAAVAVM